MGFCRVINKTRPTPILLRRAGCTFAFARRQRRSGCMLPFSPAAWHETQRKFSPNTTYLPILGLDVHPFEFIHSSTSGEDLAENMPVFFFQIPLHDLLLVVISITTFHFFLGFKLGWARARLIISFLRFLLGSGQWCCFSCASTGECADLPPTWVSSCVSNPSMIWDTKGIPSQLGFFQLSAHTMGSHLCNTNWPSMRFHLCAGNAVDYLWFLLSGL